MLIEPRRILDLRHSLLRGLCSRLAVLAREKPTLARELVNLLPQPVSRFMALTLIAWVWTDEPHTRVLAGQLLTDLGGCETASHYYEIMTRSNRMPVSVGRQM